MAQLVNVARRRPGVPATSVLSASSAAKDTSPQPGWRRPRGRRRVSWLHLVYTDLNLRSSDALNLVLDRTT